MIGPNIIPVSHLRRPDDGQAVAIKLQDRDDLTNFAWEWDDGGFNERRRFIHLSAMASSIVMACRLPFQLIPA